MPEGGDRAAERVTPALLRGWALPEPDGDKEAKGRVLVVGGSARTPGAVVLAAEAALRVGAGKVQVATTAESATQVATAVPECLVVGFDTHGGELAPSAADGLLELAASADAVVAGPGFGDPAAACALLEAVLPHLSTPLVLDAVGTAFVTAHPDGIRHLAGRALLTPNLLELAQALGEEQDEVDRDVLSATRRLADRTGVTVLSGADVSFVAEPSGEAWLVDVGSSGTAVAGSGDVKAGAVAGLVARGATPAQAAAWGAFVHGRAGELLTHSVGRVGFLARELATELPHALRELDG